MQNFIERGEALQGLVPSYPAAPVSGDPVLVGASLTGVAAGDPGHGNNPAGALTVLTEGVFSLPVQAINSGGNSAVAVGDKIYYKPGNNPPLCKDDTGALFGKAVGSVTAGATFSIPVKLIQA